MSTPQKTLIVVVTYNRADVTNIMLDSLYQAKNLSKFDVFIVDNLSQKNELELIKSKFYQLSKNYPQNTFIENKINSGYSAANNQGIKHAFENQDQYSHICLLNNDTIVTDYWLDHMIAHDDQNSLLGPITNSVGNEQRVIIDYNLESNSNNTFETVNNFSQRWFESHKTQTEKSNMLGFFCVFGSTSVFKKIGLLDENFGIGMFEDDDYCQRALSLNINLTIVRDTFIHHWGSASFSKIKKQKFFETFDKNKKYWETKHNKKWMSYYTTTVDSLNHELKWYTKNPSDLSLKSLQNFEATVKHLIQNEFNNSNLIMRGSVSDLLIEWQSKNIHAGKFAKIMALLLAYVFQLFPSYIQFNQLTFSNFINQIKQIIKETNEN